MIFLNSIEKHYLKFQKVKPQFSVFFKKLINTREKCLNGFRLEAKISAGQVNVQRFAG